MIKFTCPKNLNGETLIEELKVEGIIVAANVVGIQCPSIDDEGNLWLDIDAKFEQQAKIIVENHNG